MIALIASVAIVVYVLLPGVLFRTIFSFFLPLKKFQRSRTDEITFAVGIAFLPFVLALGLIWTVERPFGMYPFNFDDTVAQRRADYKMVFAGFYDEEVFRKQQSEFWKATTRVLRRQGRMLTWYYTLLLAEALLLGWLSLNYGRFYSNKYYAWFADNVLLPNIEEWHLLLTPFSQRSEPETQVRVDVLTSGDHLYRGQVLDYFTDTEGKLTGVFLMDAARFQRHPYIQAIQAGEKPDPDNYWKQIPGAKLYISAGKILNLNISYEPTVSVSLENRLRRILAKLGIEGQISTEEKSAPGFSDRSMSGQANS